MFATAAQKYKIGLKSKGVANTLWSAKKKKKVLIFHIFLAVSSSYIRIFADVIQ
jgi:hypothetical protein